MINSRIYNILLAPRISEKATSLGENVYVFKVKSDASKPEIAQAVKMQFGVVPKKVTTLNVKGKSKKVKQKFVTRSDWKKAYVTLKDGESIDFEQLSDK